MLSEILPSYFLKLISVLFVAIYGRPNFAAFRYPKA